MSALPDTVVPFVVPKKPKVKQKDAPPDLRKVAVLPIRAVFDQKLTHGALQVLAAVCAYANRAGITWVSQTRLAKELGISQQAVAKQFKQLREAGYLETVRKGFKGERTDTLRVIFDPTVDADTAIAVTSAIEDTRPPVMKKEQAMQAEQPDPEGLKRVAQAIAQVLKTPTKRTYAMPKSGETITVRNMKAVIKKAQTKESKPVDKASHIHNPQVVNEEPLQLQPGGCAIHNPEVVHNTELTHIRGIKEDSFKRLNTVLHNSEIERLTADGLTAEQIADSLDTLLPIYRAEGIEPTSAVLAEGIRQLQADAR